MLYYNQLNNKGTPLMKLFDIFMIIFVVTPVSLLYFIGILLSLVPLIPSILIAFPVTFYANCFKGIEVYELETKFKYTAYPYYWMHKQLVEKIYRGKQVDGWQT